MNEPTHLDLFSGIGGFALAAQWAGFRTIGFCEIDAYCRKVLAKNFGAENVADAISGRRGRQIRAVQIDRSAIQSNGQPCDATQPQSPHIISDIFDLDGTQFRGVSLITGGFPCQPFSVAGKRRGAADDRAIWPEMFSVISEARPAWVLGENVPGIIPMELDNVLSDLEGIGYSTRAFVIPACAVDARHRRDRLWIVGRFMGYSTSEGLLSSTQRRIRSGEESAGSRNDESQRRSEAVSDAYQQGSQGRDGQELPECASERVIGTSDSSVPNSFNDGSLGARGNATIERSYESNNGLSIGNCSWLPEPNVGRVAHGIPSRVDRLKGLGNAIVPQVAYEILREIRKLC